VVWRYESDLDHYCSSYGFTEEYNQFHTSRPAQPTLEKSISAVLIKTGKVVRVLDAQSEVYLDHATARRFGFSQMVGVPILSDGKVWGSIIRAWPEADTPLHSHIALIQTFAEQASIAIANSRFLHETQEALAYQTATSDVLAVISRSPHELNPVLDEVLNVAARICEPQYAFMALLDTSDGKYHVVASRHADKVFIKYMQDNPVAPGHGTCIGRTALLRETVYVRDTKTMTVTNGEDTNSTEIK
jgi:hypothetical protein